MNILIPMAGFGSRFNESHPDTIKPLININGKPMFQWAVDSINLPGELYFTVLEEHDRSHNLSYKIKQIYPNSKIIRLKKIARGASETCLLAAMHMDQSLPLIIFNCDQIINYDASKFKTFIDTSKCDGCVITFNSSEPCFGYAKYEENKIT